MNIDNNVKHQRKYTWLNLQGLNNTDYHLTILYIRQYTVLYLRLCYNVKNSKIYIYFTTYIDACYVYFQKKKNCKNFTHSWPSLRVPSQNVDFYTVILTFKKKD